MRESTLNWLKFAQSDLETIKEIIHNEDLTHVTAFHSQQCIEKSFKAIIEEYQLSEHIRTHNLLTLYKLTTQVVNLKVNEDLLELVNKLYIDSRYPGEIGLLSYGKPKITDAKKFYKLAQEIYDNMYKKLTSTEK